MDTVMFLENRRNPGGVLVQRRKEKILVAPRRKAIVYDNVPYPSAWFHGADQRHRLGRHFELSFWLTIENIGHRNVPKRSDENKLV
jgi:hypothetical protein